MANKQDDSDAPNVTVHHTVKAYDAELTRLKNIIAELGGLAELQLASAVTALDERNTELAEKIIAGDRRLDELDAAVNSFVVRLLALRQPMARDLRLIVSSLRISSDLERIGDLSKNLAKRTLTLAQSSSPRGPRVARVGRLVQTVLRDIIDAYISDDALKATDAWKRDGEIDDLCTALFSDVLSAMAGNPQTIAGSTHLLFAIKNIERIGDHANNIAESVHFMVLGHPMGDVRPKGADSSFAVPTSPKPHPGD